MTTLRMPPLAARAVRRLARAAAALSIATAAAPLAAPLLAQDPVVVDGINQYGWNAYTIFQVGSIGWAYTPTQSYALGGILTRFADLGRDRDVTVEVLDGTRTTQLASATFNSATARGQMGGGYFGSPLTLVAGTTYLIGFRNVGPVGDDSDPSNYLGANLAYWATPEGRLANVWYGFDDAEPYAYDATADDTEIETQPILQFVSPVGGAAEIPTSTVPEPSTVALCATGLAVLAAGARRRRA
jgi:hypothetical protein